MALSKPIRVALFTVATVVALVSCAKKDSEFKGRKNAAGAAYAGNEGQNKRGDAAGAAYGLGADVITKISDPQMNGNSLVVTTEISVGGQLFDISTSHNSVGTVSEISGDVAGFGVRVEGVCGSETCSPYYLMLSFTRANQPVKQIAMKKYFFYNGDGTQVDYVLARAPGEFLQNVLAARQILDAGVVEEAQQ